MMKFPALNLLTLLIFLTSPAISQASISYLSHINVTRGQISEQNLAVLNSAEQSGDDDNWNTYIEAAPGAKRFNGIFVFTAATPPEGSAWQNLILHINTLGATRAEQRWIIQIRDFDNKHWVTLGDNSDAADWRWLKQTLSLQGDPSRYIDKHHKIKIRYHSNNAVDVSNIDLMTVELTASKPVASGHWWQPSPYDNITWQWQINGNLDTSLNVDMYDVDLFDTSTAEIQSLKNQGRVVVCYFSAGTYEGWRSDWRAYFPFITGDSYSGNKPPFAGEMADWDERWLDIRRIDLLAPIMTSRLDLAVSKGCDGVEPDNVDAYTNGSQTQLPLSAADQLAYNRWLAQQAHQRGLSVGLKNDVEQLDELVDEFDWALNEQCFQYHECAGYQVFVDANKAVFGVEYHRKAAQFCPQANSQHLYWLKKKLSLNQWREGCEDY